MDNTNKAYLENMFGNGSCVRIDWKGMGWVISNQKTTIDQYIDILVASRRVYESFIEFQYFKAFFFS